MLPRAVHGAAARSVERSLERRIRGSWARTRAARAINGDWGSCGKVFTYRYHASQIRTARYARHALAYVLNNWRRHREDFANGRMLTANLDEYSSALRFDGWTRTFARPRDYEPFPVSPAKTWLLRDGWRRYGLIDPHECPGPLEHSARW